MSISKEDVIKILNRQTAVGGYITWEASERNKGNYRDPGHNFPNIETFRVRDGLKL